MVEDLKKIKFISSSKYEWEIKECLSVSSLKFAAKRKDNEKEYFCILLNKAEQISLYEECEKYDSIVRFCDKIESDVYTFLLYEKGEMNNPIDEKKLLEMFIKLNEINLAGSKIIVFYHSREIIFKDGRYQIYPTAVRKKSVGQEEYLLAICIHKIFRKFDLSLKDEIEKIIEDIRKKEIIHICNLDKHREYLAENNLNKKLSILIH